MGLKPAKPKRAPFRGPFSLTGGPPFYAAIGFVLPDAGIAGLLSLLPIVAAMTMRANLGLACFHKLEPR